MASRQPRALSRSPAPGVTPMFQIRRTPKRKRRVLIGVLFIVLTGLGLLLLGLTLQTEPEEVGLLVLPTGMIVVGTLLGGLFLHSILARRAIREIVLEIETPVLHLDDPFEVTSRFVPRTDFQVNAVRAAFICVEKAYYRAGTRSRTFTKVVYSKEQVLADHARCRRNNEVEFSGSFHSPADGMCSFVGTNHSVRWKMRICVDIARWPDVTEEFEITVLPVLGERPPGA